jgi:hypothetical protein
MQKINNLFDEPDIFLTVSLFASLGVNVPMQDVVNPSIRDEQTTYKNYNFLPVCQTS